MSKRTIIVIAIVMMFLGVMYDYIFAGPYFVLTLFSPSLGVAMGFYFANRRRYFHPVFITYLLTVFVSRIVFVDETIWMTIGITFFKSFVLWLHMKGTVFLLLRLKNNGYRHLNMRDNINYVVGGFLVIILVGILYLVPVLLVFEYSDPFKWIVYTLVGNILGFIVFGSTINYSLFHDEETISSRKLLYGSIYMVLSVILFIVLFSEPIPLVTYQTFSYLFFILYVIGVLFFEFRIIIYNNVLFLGFYSWLYLDNSVQLEYTNEYMGIILMLFSITIVAFVISLFFKTSKTSSHKVNVLNRSFKELIITSNHLFSNLDQISESTSINDFSKIFLSRIFKVGLQVVDKYDYASCFIKTEDKVEYIDSIGYDIDYLNGLNLLSENFNWSLQEPIIVDYDVALYSKDLAEDNEFMKKYPRLKQSVRFTIYFDHEPVAGMSFDITEKQDQVFDSTDLSFFKEYQSLINSYYNVALMNNMNNEMRKDIVKSLVRALGLYDSYTGTHSEEVALLAGRIAQRMHLSKEQYDRVYWAAIVHDIGKIGIDNTILNKTEELSKQEIEVIKTHPVLGYEILNKAQGLQNIALRVKYHHERWDGTGYPEGLKGSDIPICSQILSVCDAVSAMAKDRIYSKGKSIDEIIGELYMEKGKQFNPMVADIMIDYIKETQLKELYDLKEKR
jgi:HD-GYP domain-containing protein (c-di-GMP phosphodiesterase class II)